MRERVKLTLGNLRLSRACDGSEALARIVIERIVCHVYDELLISRHPRGRRVAYNCYFEDN